MKHLTEEELIAQALNEGAGAVAGPIPGPIEDHLKACTECADSYLVLLTDLAAMRSMAPPERDQSYGERVWESLAPSLAAYKPRRWGWWPRRDWPSAGPNPKWWRGLAYAGAGALLMVGAFFAGSQWEHWKQGPPTASVEHKAPQTKQPIVVVVLDDHLDRSERFLVQLKHADLDSAAMASPMRDEARSLLAANKVCRQKAAQTSDPELTQALDHLDQLLAEAANEPGGLNATSIAKLQDEMNSDGLLFEVRVLRSRIANRKATGNSSMQGGTI
jgi:hypothetical protein